MNKSNRRARAGKASLPESVTSPATLNALPTPGKLQRRVEINQVVLMMNDPVIGKPGTYFVIQWAYSDNTLETLASVAITRRRPREVALRLAHQVFNNPSATNYPRGVTDARPHLQPRTKVFTTPIGVAGPGWCDLSPEMAEFFNGQTGGGK